MSEQVEQDQYTEWYSEGPYWVKVNIDGDEIERVEKPKLPIGRYLDPFAVYGATLNRDIGQGSIGEQIGIMTVPGGKLIILRHGEPISVDATEGEDFAYIEPIKVLEEAPEIPDKDGEEAKNDAIESIKGKAAMDEFVSEHAVQGIDVIAELIEAEKINIDPAKAKIQVFHGDGSWSENGVVVIFDDSGHLKYDKQKVRSLVESGKMPGYVVQPGRVKDMIFLLLEARYLLIDQSSTLGSKMLTASKILDILDELKVL